MLPDWLGGGGGRRPGMAVELLLLVLVLPSASGHGYLKEPPGRSSMWRVYKHNDILPNYNDMGLNCGGMWYQWGVHGGKCGVCGDPYTGTQDNLPPNGKYAKGIIGRCYPAGTGDVPVVVQLTANHKGYMEFHICPHNDINKPVSEECLKANRLMVRQEDGSYRPQLQIVTGMDTIEVMLQLPPGMMCAQCVIRWTYNTGNNWGCDEVTKECGLGKGKEHETFVNCADVAILSSCEGVEGHKPNSAPWQPVRNPTYPLYPWPAFGGGQQPVRVETSASEALLLLGNDPRRCVAVGRWLGRQDIAIWCERNCPHSCPNNMCLCRWQFPLDEF